MAKKSKQSLQDSLLEELKNSVSKNFGIYFKKFLSDCIVSQGNVEVINRYGVENEKVAATPWIDNYLIYIKISFNGKEKYYKYTVNVSIFYGDNDNTIQLLRADWDSYPIKNGYNHPQPHWHFTALNSDRIRSFNELEDSQDDLDMFSELKSPSPNIKLEKIHFAMAGTLMGDNMICRPISDKNEIISWLMNLLEHLKEELLYIQGLKR